MLSAAPTPPVGSILEHAEHAPPSADHIPGVGEMVSEDYKAQRDELLAVLERCSHINGFRELNSVYVKVHYTTQDGTDYDCLLPAINQKRPFYEIFFYILNEFLPRYRKTENSLHFVEWSFYGEVV